MSWLGESLRKRLCMGMIFQLIITCVTSTKFSITINGVGHELFEGRRGIMQRDPVSPLMFVLVMEYVTRMMKCMSNLPNFKFHSMYKQLKLTYLIFVDGLMIFCKAKPSLVASIMEDLQHFSRVTGLVTNMD